MTPTTGWSQKLSGGFVAGAYTYNAEGQRVRRKVGATETWKVYGIDGELLADSRGRSGNESAEGIRLSKWKVAGNSRTQRRKQHGPMARGRSLGTPRMIADKTGSLAGIKRHDYLPFGEELLAGTGNRTAAMGYTADSVRQKFTSHERDNETGLDYMQARYFNNQAGRLSAPTWLWVQAHRLKL